MELETDKLKGSLDPLAERTEAVLRFLARRGWEDFGEGYFSAFLKFLVKKAGMSHAMIGRLTGDHKSIETIALYINGFIVENIEYPIKGTISEIIIHEKTYYANVGIRTAFPDDRILSRTGAEACAGISLVDSKGIPVGVILVMGNEPIKDVDDIYSLLRVASIRTAAEILRLTYEEQLLANKKYLEEAIKRKVEELEATEKKLGAAKRLADIGTFAAIVAHELRNPLGVIRLAAHNIMTKSKEDVILKEHIDSINKKVLESEHIIKNLLSYSTVGQSNFEKIFIKDVLDESLRYEASKHAGAGVKVKTCGNRKEQDTITADKIQMLELYLNMIENAYQSMNDTGGEIEITEDYYPERNTFTVQFKDNGVGIDQLDLKKIFEPFFTKKKKGIGLGLPLCKQIVDIHNGEILVESVKGKGTSFIIRFPIRQ